MDAENNIPNGLRQAIVHFDNPENCRKFMVAIRWADGVVKCPNCGSDKVVYLAKQDRYKCYGKHPKAQFSLKVGTIFEDSPLGLNKWLPAAWQVMNCKNGISSYELARALEVTQKTAWFMLSRLRLAMQDDLTGGTLGGEVEVDETFIGGKSRNMHAKDRCRKINKPNKGKIIVLGMLERKTEERGSRVRATVIADRTRKSIAPEVAANVEPGSQVHSDEAGWYWKMDDLYTHSIIQHADSYVNGNIHTNGIENFWSLLKRSIGGTYVSVEPFHLFRYIDEQAFRFNNRKMSDAERFTVGMKQIVGRRVTFDQLTGKIEVGGHKR